jgi:hypothetical protein
MTGLPASQYDPRRLFVFSCPSLPFSKYKRATGVYIAGGLVSKFACMKTDRPLRKFLYRQFALAHWMFWDAAILSSHAKLPQDAPYDTIPVHVTFLDWIPGICSTLGLLVVNLINKEHLLSDGGYHQEPTIVWRARLFLFVGFALMAGGLAGSVVRRTVHSIFSYSPDLIISPLFSLL